MIKEITLKNFKTFDDETFSIAPLTLITGINGVGKSSIIQSLLLLKQNYEIKYIPAKASMLLKQDFIDLESAESLCYFKADERTVDIVIVDENAMGCNNTYKWELDASVAGSTELPYIYTGPEHLDKLPLFSSDFIFLEAERWGPRREYEKRYERTYNTKLGIQGELTPAYLNNAINTNQELGLSKMRNESLPENSTQLTENVNAWMSQIMKLPLKTVVNSINDTKVKLEYKFEGNKGKSFSALQVGFGFTFVLPIVVALLQAKESDLIIIENPEAHLHPAAQVELGLMVAQAVKNGVQVIMESHSDHILNSLRLARKTGILDKEEDINLIFAQRNLISGSSISFIDEIKIKDSGKLTKRPEYFFDTWDDVLTKLIE